VLLSPLADLVLGEKFDDYLAADAREWRDFTVELGFEAAVRRYARNRIEIAERLGHDMLYVVPCPPERRPAPPKPVIDPSSPVVPAAPRPPAPPPPEDPIERVILRNQNKRAHRNDPLNESTFFVYEALIDEMRLRGTDLPILAPCWFHGVWTDTDLMETIALEPEIAREHYELATASSNQFIDKYSEYGINLIGVGGDFAGKRTLISPKTYHDLITPELKKLTDRIHEVGAYAINASDGDLWSVIDDYLIGSGVDGCIEIDSRAGMDLKLLKERFGKTITFFGNMDCGEVLSFYTPDEIRAVTVKCLEDGYGSGGHVFCSSNAITHSVPAVNYFAMANAYRNYFGLPKIKIGET
jgi:hypothetical protein